MHILIVEDNPLVASGLKSGLELHGFTCDVAATQAQAGSHLAASHFDACVLDLGLPDGNGLDLLRAWRGRGQDLPVLILTARSSLEDKVAGFQTGTDDYLTKPFDLQELALRLQALLRRAAGRASDALKLGDCQINPATCEAWRDGQAIELSRREWALLTALLQARGRILSPAQLHDSLYGFDLDVGSNTVNVHVHHLRKKLGNDTIETVRGLGFRLGARYRADAA
ncbi:response regulator [Comamonas aquatica]|jgi:DNA-binding response OmpR family regulator|uniref:Response regulator n=1 Tax=Comamonas aquatica TaxID=225991 RepID=A0AA42HSS8_9BURK|nr:response regulator [Comamonas aquatica]MDH0363912.1 response regulator [Comamonas aquatica]MDH1765794.1 response regulator [Comamonas aquatica]